MNIAGPLGNSDHNVITFQTLHNSNQLQNGELHKDEESLWHLRDAEINVLVSQVPQVLLFFLRIQTNPAATLKSIPLLSLP